MNIVVADITDIEELTQVQIATRLHSFETNEAYAIDHDRGIYNWQTYFAGQTPVSARPERAVFKVMENGKMTGFIAIQLTTRYDMDAEIQSFFVLKDQQRKGVGAELLKQALDWLEDYNAQSLCVGIFPENPYKAFYLKYGGRYINPHWIFWDDMEKLSKVV